MVLVEPYRCAAARAKSAKYSGLAGRHLSVPGGHISISWKRKPATEGHGVEICWNEEGGPKVKQPRQRGFGSMVIEQNLTRALDAEVTMDFAPTGLRCRMVIPVVQLSVGR